MKNWRAEEKVSARHGALSRSATCPLSLAPLFANSEVISRSASVTHFKCLKQFEFQISTPSILLGKHFPFAENGCPYTARFIDAKETDQRGTHGSTTRKAFFTLDRQMKIKGAIILEEVHHLEKGLQLLLRGVCSGSQMKVWPLQFQ